MASELPVILITGAAKRIGAQIARTLHQAGYDLALHYRHSRNEMDALRSELEPLRPDSTIAIQGDLADVAALPGIVEKCTSRFGRLDAVVNNASAFFPTPIGDATPEQWDELFASNARAPFFLAQAAASVLKKSSGCIVNIVDIYAQQPLARYPIYSMAKAALEMMTKSLARELAPEIRVNGVAPGAILWPDAGQVSTNQDDLVAKTPLQRTGSSEEIAKAVLFLIRDATFTTGQILKVDGGRSLAI
ncbi:MAG TPA: pteridine reductase [Rudaea sp.]|jgi:pteridine reductase|nr:pteridine reductase [Rudaea sp.]